MQQRKTFDDGLLQISAAVINLRTAAEKFTAVHCPLLANYCVEEAETLERVEVKMRDYVDRILKRYEEAHGAASRT